MNIRPAERGDLKALVELNREVQELHAKLKPSVFKPTSNHDMAPGLAEFIDNDRFHTFIVEDNGKTIGYAVGEFRHQGENAFKYSRNSLLIHQISVAWDHRRRGVASALLDHFQILAERAGVTRLEIDVYTANREAKAFYIARGFGSFRELMEKDVTQ
jgi:ribosomal protein S18 acetylase RimI-like enzyme